MGSSITVKDNVAHINGVKKLRGMTLVGSDLRSSAALIIAALISIFGLIIYFVRQSVKKK